MFSALGDVPNIAMREFHGVPTDPHRSVPDMHAQLGSPLQLPGVYRVEMSDTSVHGESCWSEQPDRHRFAE